jgi:hypothetical protein
LTVRNRHDRTRDHEGELGLDDVDVDEMEGFSARTSLTDVLLALAGQVGTAVQLRSFTIDAQIKVTVEWPLVQGISIDAVIGTPSAEKRPGFFTIDAVKA